MKLKLINIDEFCKELPAITSPKIFENGKVSRHGLLSLQIFGPTRSFHCGCPRSNYHGGNSGKKKCPICEVDITTSDERRRRFAKIELPFPILNPIFYYLITSSKTSSKQVIDNLLSYNYKYYFNEDEDLIKVNSNTDITNHTLLEGLDGAVEVIKFYTKDKSKKQYEFIQNNIDQITLNNIIVIPPDFRFCSKIKDSGTYMSDNINQLYTFILIRCSHVKKIPYDISTDDVYKTNFRHIQKSAIELYDHVLERMSKKTGLIRGSILGKRMDFSGRAVISPDPKLQINECKIPYLMALEAFKPQLSAYLIGRKICRRLNKAVDLIEDCIRTGDNKLFDLVRHFCKGKICILNRQPTLHRLSVLAFNIDVHLAHTIRIHPLIVSPFNADFDGDSADCIVKITKSGSQEEQVLELKDILDNFKFEEISSKVKQNNVKVIKYKPLEVLEINSINVNNGKTELKEIKEFSVHENLEMFKINDNRDRFKDFWVSYDHSLIVYDEIEQKIKSITPKELLENPKGKYLIKN